MGSSRLTGSMGTARIPGSALLGKAAPSSFLPPDRHEASLSISVPGCRFSPSIAGAAALVCVSSPGNTWPAIAIAGGTANSPPSPKSTSASTGNARANRAATASDFKPDVRKRIVPSALHVVNIQTKPNPGFPIWNPPSPLSVARHRSTCNSPRTTAIFAPIRMIEDQLDPKWYTGARRAGFRHPGKGPSLPRSTHPSGISLTGMKAPKAHLSTITHVRP